MVIKTINVNANKIEIRQAAFGDKSVFRNLMQLYQYDTSDFAQLDPDSHGLFEYRYLDHYWTDYGIEAEGRIALLVKVNDQLAGFALINNFSMLLERNSTTRSMAEFFILKKWRRQSIGKTFATEIFDLFPGHWEIKQERDNVQAHSFWRNVINHYTNGIYREFDMKEERWDGPMQVFDNGR
ncbi:GNAT family N-acetyltransferase [Paenibacillus sp. J2TS4]|uniref:GNAT family N-acetyltransferase n=1 Tax=Paenibacillus sp. J2TS4 TaxID=2807194 RepID=UPI001B035D15|nr:GNAT family N-acetyltransferase [Paenibacillus sp. J2TS4]GIP31879.1 hypothetical protein J2TS4_10890 [Paenibacillus sp. J2TS4]